MNRTDQQTPNTGGTGAWKGTVIMVGLIALLFLLNGCYTVLATGGAAYRTPDRYETGGWEEEPAVVEEVPMESTQGVGVRTEGYETAYDPYYEGDNVGVRYRTSYNGPQGSYEEYVYDTPVETVVYYRRPWVRRVYVDWYLYNSYHRGPWPHRRGFSWSVGWHWGGFDFAFGSYDPYWHDPFYWDYWWCEPYWPRRMAFTYWDPYWDAPRWAYWHANWWYPGYWDPWYRPYWEPYYAYSPWYVDDYGWWGHHRPIVVADQPYGRRPADRRRGLVDARTPRGTVAGGVRDGTRTSRGTPTLGDARTPRSGTSNGMPRTGRGTATLGDSRGSAGSGLPRTGRGTAGTRTTGGRAGSGARRPGSGATGTKTRRPPGGGGGSEVGDVKVPRTAKGGPDTDSTVRIIRNGLGDLVKRAADRKAKVRRPDPKPSTPRATRIPVPNVPRTTGGSRPTVNRPPRTTSRPPRTTSRPPRTTSRPPRTTSRPPRTTSRPPTRVKVSRPPRTSRPPKTSRPPTGGKGKGKVKPPESD